MTSLKPGEEFRSNGVRLVYQGDGNLVLYDGNTPIWDTHTFAQAGSAEMQGDGNLVLYDASGTPYWASNTFGENPKLHISRTELRITAQATIWKARTAAQPGPPPPPVMNLSRLAVEDNKRYFRNNDGRFQWREISAFSLLSRLLAGETDYVRNWLFARRAEGFTMTRVILTLDGDYWTRSPLGRSFRCAPDMPGYSQALDTLAALHAEAGLYMRACFLGALEPFGGVWYPDRRDVYEGDVRRKAEEFVVNAARQLGVYANVVGELANEPTQIGMRRAWDNGALYELGRRVKAVAPDMLLCGGEDAECRGLKDPFDFADCHFERLMGVSGWQWVKRMGEDLVVDQPHEYPEGHAKAGQPTNFKQMPFVNGENVNMGESRRDGRTGDVEPQPSVCFGVTAIGRARKMAGACFHWDGGLWTTEPRDETPACIKAWHEGFDAFPMLTGNMWRGHWSREQGNYWSRDPYPASDDLRVITNHLDRGIGPWRVFGCEDHSVGFPLNKNADAARHILVPADRKGYNDQGTYAVGVYRKR